MKESFSKYARQGAYHWNEISHSIRKHNAFTSARYTRVLQCLPARPGQLVLDMGCGDGALSGLITGRGVRVIGLDREELGVRYAAARIPKSASFVCGTVYQTPFADASFDAVVVSEVIEHVARPETLLAEACRILRPAGTVIVTTPYRLTERPTDPEHVREFFPDEIAAMMQHHFQQVTVRLSHPAWLGELYVHTIGGRRVFSWIVNVLAVWLRRNPFLTRHRYRHYMQMVATGTRAS
jgi:2-polyprenyl-3-methyl-5-hydroxy-6-metoxy-1,4-benzoquinol methylase